MPKRKSNKRRSCVKKPRTETVMSQVEFNAMNVDCIKLIFDELSLQELIKLRPVCSKWNAIISSDICAPKRSLHLIIMHYANKDLPIDENTSGYNATFLQLMNPEQDPINKTRNELKIYQITQKPREYLNTFLSRLFPGIQNLLISKRNLIPKDNQLIGIWSTQLVTLTLMFNEISPYAIGGFYKTLNKSTGLRKLNLLAKYLYRLSFEMLKPTFDRLESFASNTQLNIPTINTSPLGSLPLLGANCHRLGLNCDSEYDFIQKFAHILKLNPRDKLNLVNNITHLTLMDFKEAALMELILKHFCHLKHLSIHASVFPYYSLMPDKLLSSLLPAELVNMTKLEELTLLNIDLNLDYGDDIKVPANVSSVKSLTLTANDYFVQETYPDGWCARLANIFPKLEQLSVKYESKFDENLMFKEELDGNRAAFKHLKCLKTEVGGKVQKLKVSDF